MHASAMALFDDLSKKINGQADWTTKFHTSIANRSLL